LHWLGVPVVGVPAIPEAMKSALRFSKASGSTRRKVEKIVQLGERAMKRALSASRRREFTERLANEN
jgi:hypothetical protein